MPRYFFNSKDGELLLDDTGVELSGPEAAREAAVVSSGELIRDRGAKFWEDPNWHMWVADENGETVCALRFSGE